MKAARVPGAPSPRERRDLRQQALDLVAGGPFSHLRESALAAIRARPLDEPIAIACSGGADSVALLMMLWGGLPERRGRWLVLHFDHRLRGAASTADARFVRMLARRLGERCVVGRWTRKAAGAKKKASEAEARDARWRFFTREMHAVHARVIALGHQRDDVAETMLMRLTRGSATGALAAPRPVQTINDGTVRVRPLLDFPGKVLRLFLARFHVPWREDATNATDDFFRNRVRHHVLPALEQAAGRDPASGFRDTRDRLEEDDEALNAWLDMLAGRPAPGATEKYDLSVLRGKPVALARRAAHRWFRAVGLTETPGNGDVDELAERVVAGATWCFSAGRDRFVHLHEGKLALQWTGDGALRARPWLPTRLNEGGEATGPRGDRLRLRRLRLTSRLWTRIRAGDFPQDSMAYLDPGPDWRGWVDVRDWRLGDSYRPLGAPGRAKLQDQFVNRRVPRDLRPLLPVVADCQGNVIWVPGLPVAEAVAVQPAGKHVVQLTYVPAPPIVHRSKAHNLTDVRHRKA